MTVRILGIPLNAVGTIAIVLGGIAICVLYDLWKYLVIFLVASNSFEIWSDLLVDTDNCKFGSL